MVRTRLPRCEEQSMHFFFMGLWGSYVAYHLITSNQPTSEQMPPHQWCVSWKSPRKYFRSRPVTNNIVVQWEIKEMHFSGSYQ